MFGRQFGRILMNFTVFRVIWSTTRENLASWSGVILVPRAFFVYFVRFVVAPRHINAKPPSGKGISVAE